MLTRLFEAQTESLRANAERFLAFLGAGPMGPLELQILGGRRKFEENKYAHPASMQDALRLLQAAEAESPTGVYVVCNEPDDAVTARAERGVWHVQRKGEATTDADIVARRALFVDVDWARARGTSSTDEDCLRALSGAATIAGRIAEVIPASAIGLGHSGNGGSVFVALDRIPESPAVAALVKEALYCLSLAHTDPRIRADRSARNGIDIDVSVSDAKRLCPAYGTTKRKGASTEARPHRRTAFVTLGDGETKRLTLDELARLVEVLRGDLDEAGRSALEVEMRRARRAPAAAKRATSSSASPSQDPFATANAVPVLDVLGWLGLLDGEQPICPGCGESDGSAVAIVGNGLKCMHNRCSRAGVRDGFRPVVDIVCDARKLEPIAAVRELAERFGFAVADRPRPERPPARRDRPAPAAETIHDADHEDLPEPPPRDPDEPPPSDDDAPDAPTPRRAPKLPAHVAAAGPWTSQLKLDRWGQPKPTYGNLCLVLRNAYGQRLAYDEMAATSCLDGRTLGDADVGRVREELENVYALPVTESNIMAAVRQVAEERRYHPVRAYLEGLKWDAKVRIPSLATEVLGTDDPLHARMLTAWLVQAVKRALEPGCKADAALVLVGPQGFFKSTFFAVLGGPFFADTKMDISSRDGLMQLASSWIYEWSELENVTSRKQAAEVKAFMTSQSDTFRPPFGRATIKHPRSSVIVGSTNEEQFLSDPTGSRRFWIVPVRRRINETSLAWMREHRDQLWAEAVTNLHSGYQAYLTLDEEARREELAGDHHVADAFQDAIAAWLGTRKARELEVLSGWLTMADLLEHALELDKSRWDRPTQTRVGHAMQALGWSRVRRRLPEGRCVWTYLRPETEKTEQFPLWQQ